MMGRRVSWAQSSRSGGLGTTLKDHRNRTKKDLNATHGKPEQGTHHTTWGSKQDAPPVTQDPQVPSPWGEGSPKLRSDQGSGLLPSLMCSASLGSESLVGERRHISPRLT